MTTYYDQVKQRLIFIHQHATPSFWDKHWAVPDFKAHIKQGAKEKFYTSITKRFLVPHQSTRILEGGCGRGHVVYALTQAGYDVYGVDYAKQTVKRINQTIPELKIFHGDVTRLNFPDNHFDGYWSLGVIEHNFTGYGPILREMQRVIKPGGYLFVTFPHLSWLRKIKAAAGAYPAFNASAGKPDGFYQFALSHRRVQQDLSQLGFTLRHRRPVDGFKGLQDEVTALRPVMQRIKYSSTLTSRILGGAITELAAPVSGHIMLQVLQKQCQK